MRQTLGNPFKALLLSAVLSFGTVPGCAPAAASARLPIYPSSGPTVTVTVNNRHWTDMRVYIIASSAQHRLGLVSGLSSATFNVPRVIPTPSELRFLAVPLAHGESQSTDAIVVAAGDAVVFTIGHIPASSSLSLRR